MNRLTALPVIGSALLAACAATPNEISSLPAEPVSPAAVVAAAPPSADAPAVPDPVVVEITELDADTGPVCESKQRPGSRIARVYCVSREAHAAMQAEQAEAAQDYARDLDRERALKDQQGRMGVPPPSVIVFQ